MRHDSPESIARYDFAKSYEKKLIKINQNEFVAYIKAKPEKGKANIELIELLSEKLKIAKNKIWIKNGLKSRYKIIYLIT